MTTLATLVELIGADLALPDDTVWTAPEDPGSLVVRDLRCDAELIAPGELFVPRYREDRSTVEQVREAVARGAIAVVLQRQIFDTPVPQLIVADLQRAIPVLAAEVHQHASRRLDVVAVTGTDGKTTVCFLIDSILRAAGRRSALAGTVGVRVEGRAVRIAQPGSATSVDAQRLYAQLADMGIAGLALEATVGGIAGGHLDQTRIAVAAFTNLAHEHLDVHGSMDAYFEAKAALFVGSASPRPEHSVVMIDDEWGERLVERLERADGSCLTTVSRRRRADVWADQIEPAGTQTRFVLHGVGDEPVAASVSMFGEHNVANAVVAAACCHRLGVGIDAIIDGLAHPALPAGRAQAVPTQENEPLVVVDYAHTPQGVRSMVEAGRAACRAEGRVIVVIGAGGDRDQSKRVEMGEAATAADLVVVTSDNPRSEDPAAIAAEVAAGARRGTAEVHEQPDRRLAIRDAIDRAEPSDIVLVLGKGHERTLERNGAKTAFNDRDVAIELLEARRSK